MRFSFFTERCKQICLCLYIYGYCLFLFVVFLNLLLVGSNVQVGSTDKRNILMKSRTEGSTAELCPQHHLPLLSYLTHNAPEDIVSPNKDIILIHGGHQTKPPLSFASWSISDVSPVGGEGGGPGSP